MAAWVIIPHGIPDGVHKPVVREDIRGVGHEGVRADEGAELRVVVAGIHVDQPVGILLLAGEAVVGGEGTGESAHFAIRPIGLVTPV